MTLPLSLPAWSPNFFNVSASFNWACIWALSSCILRQLSAYSRLKYQNVFDFDQIIEFLAPLPDQLYDGGGEGHPHQDVDSAHKHVGSLF